MTRRGMGEEEEGKGEEEEARWKGDEEDCSLGKSDDGSWTEKRGRGSRKSFVGIEMRS